MQGLEGRRVLELGHMVSAAYATKLIADLGADVIKIEEPSGDRARWRGPFPHSVPDPDKMCSVAPFGLTSPHKPDIIRASISGYGHTGPQKDYMGYGPAVVPLTGLSSLTGYPGGDPPEVGIS